MNIFNLDFYARALFYAEYLIVKPLHEYNFNEFDKNKFADIIYQGIDITKTVQQLADDFSQYTKNKNVDWTWIASHIIYDNYNQRQAKGTKLYCGEETLVYKECPKKINSEFKKLYLTDPNDSNSQPKLFKLKDLIQNGTNIGRKKIDWKPTIGITDFGFYEFYPNNDKSNEKIINRYYDNIVLSSLSNGYEWNNNKNEFIFNKDKVH